MAVSSRVIKIGLPIASMLVLLVTWELVCRGLSLNLDIFPPPSRIGMTILKLLSPPGGQATSLITHSLVSLGRLAAALVFAVTAGVGIGLLAGINRQVRSVVYPLINAFMPVPPYAWIPILILWLGRGTETIVLVTTLSASLPLIYNTLAGVQAVDKRQNWALRSFGAGLWKEVYYVIIPSAFSSIILGLRLSLGQAWRTLVGAEFLAAPEAGLGFLIFNSRKFLAVDVMFAGIAVLGFFGYLFVFQMVGFIENITVVRWGIVARR